MEYMIIDLIVALIRNVSVFMLFAYLLTRRQGRILFTRLDTVVNIKYPVGSTEKGGG
jgi:hypothetical protein